MTNRNKKIGCFYYTSFRKSANTACKLVFIALLGIFLFPHSAYPSDITSENIIELTNRERVETGVNALIANPLLTRAAHAKARDILTYGIFMHNFNDRKFSAWISETGYDYSYVGENLAIDFYTAEGIMAAWKKSPTHAKNLINQYFTEIGVAVLEGQFDSRPTVLVVQIFGSDRQTVSGMTEPELTALSGLTAPTSDYGTGNSTPMFNLRKTGISARPLISNAYGHMSVLFRYPYILFSILPVICFAFLACLFVQYLSVHTGRHTLSETAV